MDAALFAKMQSDKGITDLKKMQHKYSTAEVAELVDVLKSSVYKSLALKDFNSEPLVWLENVAKVRLSAAKPLLRPLAGNANFGIKAMEEEIYSTLSIENIDSSRDSIRRILGGYAPINDDENRIYGMKQGLEFIGDATNKITEENIFKLYMLTVGDFLEEDNRLVPGNYYRHDNVYVVGGKVEHTGLPHALLPEYMDTLVAFINDDDLMDDLNKAAATHYYIAYLHPWFDGNGRMARLVHLWYLVQRGYSAALFIPFSHYINVSKQKYYNAYTLVDGNAKISRVVDITPFLVYFIENVYNKMESAVSTGTSLEAYQKALAGGKITAKENDLWNFVLSAYGTDEFSTKQLEKDFGDAAYATIRSFVQKFEKLELLHAQVYGPRRKYHVL